LSASHKGLVSIIVLVQQNGSFVEHYGFVEVDGTGLKIISGGMYNADSGEREWMKPVCRAGGGSQEQTDVERFFIDN